MLTKQDLNAIGNLIELKFESKLEEKLESKLEEKLESKLELKLLPIRNDIKNLQKDVKKLRKDLTTTINFFDNNNLKLQNQIDQTRKHVGLEEVNFGYA